MFTNSDFEMTLDLTIYKKILHLEMKVSQVLYAQRRNLFCCLENTNSRNNWADSCDFKSIFFFSINATKIHYTHKH